MKYVIIITMAISFILLTSTTVFGNESIPCGTGTIEDKGQCIPDPNYVPMETREKMNQQLIEQQCTLWDKELENLRKYGYSESSEVLVELNTEETIQWIKEMKKEIGCGNLTKSKGGGCLIATATYGSELAPQVQMLREIRDNSLLHTESGTRFMNSFNGFYYSFSPYIADLERENPAFKEIVKLAITPMISSLSILNYVDMDSEESVLGYGASLITLNLGMYFGIPAMILWQVKKRIPQKMI